MMPNTLAAAWNRLRRTLQPAKSSANSSIDCPAADAAAERLLSVAKDVPESYRLGSPSLFAAPLFRHLESAAAPAWPMELVKSAVRALRMVYSPGKVGGKTFQATTQELFPNDETYHLHHLHFLGFLQNMIAQSSDADMRNNCRVQVCHAHWLTLLLELNRSLRCRLREVAKPTIVAGVREPVALRLSGSFENAAFLQDRMNVAEVASIHDLMVEYFRIEYHWTWFRDELKPALGIDVFAEPFPTEVGWKLYENERARLLVIRQESIAKLPVALAELYGVPAAEVSVSSSNTAEDKGADYAQRYRETKRVLRFTDRELDLAYALPYARHFYSPTEIDYFRLRWSDGGAVANLRRAG